MKKLRQFFFRAWRPSLLVLSLGCIAYVLYFHNLSHLLPGYSTSELQTYATASNWHNIAHDPLNAPYKILVWVFATLGHHAVLTTRIVAASLAVAAAFLFFTIIRPWYGYRVAFMATVLFATSSGFLHIARLGSAQVLQMSILLIMASILWYRRSSHKRLLFSYTLIASFAVLWYVPGMLWFELLGVVLLRKGVLRQLEGVKLLHKILWGLLFAAILTPLLVASIRTPSLALGALGFPHSLSMLRDFGLNIGNAVLSIGLRSPGNPLMWVGHAPLLNVIELALGVMGGFYYIKHERSVRTVYLAGSLALALLLVGLGGPVTFALLVPLLYLFVACGLNNLLSQWLTVFPRNPIAKFTGILLVCIMLFFSVLYHVRSYFVAWPHNTATRQTFDQPQP